MFLLRLALCLVLSMTMARAQVTIRNFDGLGSGATSWPHKISNIDTNGNSMRSCCLGPIVQFTGDPHFYWYWPVSDADGALYSVVASYIFTGFEVYSSLDMVQWTPVGEFTGGLLFDPSPSAWQTVCTGGPVSGLYLYCYPPTMVYSPSLGKYVLWYGNNRALYSMLCDRPTGGCAATAPTIAAACGIDTSTSVYSPIPFIDSSGNGWVTYTAAIGGTTNYVQALTADYTNCTSSFKSIVSPGEAISMVQAGSTYFAVLGGNCANCPQGSAAQYLTATNPLGTWSGPTTFDGGTNSCNSQVVAISQLKLGGVFNYVVLGTGWYPGNLGSSSPSGMANQALSAKMLVPVTISGTTITPFGCPATVSLPSLTPQAPPILQVDQTSEGNPSSAECDVYGTNQVYQTFTAGQSGALGQVWVTVAQNSLACNLSIGGGTCPNPSGVNANLTVNLVNDSSGTPGSGLATLTLPAAGAKWATTRYKLVLTPPLPIITSGTVYGIKLSSPGATIGCWATQQGNLSPYSGGQLRLSTDGGTTWSTQANAGIMFSTVMMSAAARRRH